MGWGAEPAVYPPHLQLACSAMYDELPAGTITLTLQHYRSLGGFAAIVGEHLERVLETELADGRDQIARDLFLALVVGEERAMRAEDELLDVVGAKHQRHEILAVLESLRARGLLVRVRLGGDAGWELVHDSLVARVLAWIDRRDLDRRKAMELVRHHLRRSRPETPALLGRAELKELAPFPSAIEELDREWEKRDLEPGAWMPSQLVRRSRFVRRRRIATLVTSFTVLASIAGVAMYRSHLASERVAREQSLRDRDLGRFTLVLEPFDWDPVKLEATPVPATLDAYTWTLHAPDPDDIAQPGAPYRADWIVRSSPALAGGKLVEHVEAHGGPAFLVIDRAGCTPSIIPLRQLPGYINRDEETTLRLRVPTCEATRADMIELAAGDFFYGGAGEPPAPLIAEQPSVNPERRMFLPAFALDRTEVSNSAFDVFAQLSESTGITKPIYVESVANLKGRRKPGAGINWTTARAYCRYMGKNLPTTYEWTRALRGPAVLSDGHANPMPRRSFPWGTDDRSNALETIGAHEELTRDVGTSAWDVSIDGIHDLAGNIQEWTDSTPPNGDPSVRITRGAYWLSSPADLLNYLAIENDRRVTTQDFSMGLRCALER
jgi:formylglycine-generating enzyme required for sulfatase activity